MDRQQVISSNGRASGAGSLLFRTATRPLLLAFAAAVALLMVWQPLAWLMQEAKRTGSSDYYSQIVLVPFVTIYFLYQYRRAILNKVAYAVLPGGCILLGAAACYTAARLRVVELGALDFASIETLCGIGFFIGGFILLYGFSAFRAAEFPLLFLLFAVPVPRVPFDFLIYFLQLGSADLTQLFFDLTGLEYIRHGVVFQLPNITIEVAKECSGIRSSIASVIMGVLMGHLFLRGKWRRLIVVLATIPLTIFKNGIRILTLSLLAVYVDRTFITNSWLHHSGGTVFYLMSLVMLAGFVWWLRRGEKKG